MKQQYIVISSDSLYNYLFVHSYPLLEIFEFLIFRNLMPCSDLFVLSIALLLRSHAQCTLEEIFRMDTKFFKHVLFHL
jgi:hypothetical protein